MVDPQVQLFDDATTANEVDNIQEEDAGEEGEDGGATEALHHHHQHNHHSSRSSEEEENVADTEDSHQVQATTKKMQKHQGGVATEPTHHLNLLGGKNITKQAS